MARRDSFYLATVVSVHYVTPNMIRVRFGGDELKEFETSGAPDERLGLYFPNEGRSEPQRPTITDGAWEYADADDIPEGRSYTVRKVHPESGYVDIDFVVHEGGVAATWAAQAKPGDVVGLSNADGWYDAPAGASYQLLVGDATALPAIGRIIEELPAGTRAKAIVEIIDPVDIQHIDSAADVEYEWLVGTGMGRGPSALPAAVRREQIPEGAYVWAAAEASATRDIRKYLRRDQAVPGSHLTVMGYWRTKKEQFMARYQPVKDTLLARYETFVEQGLQGEDLRAAWDAELEKAGF